MPLPLYLLALAVFAMGTSEFMLAGLLPDLARDLGVSVGAAGSLTSAFAVGMVVGALPSAVLARNRPGRSALLCFVLVFLAAHVTGALTGGFGVLLVTRFVAAVAHAGFLAVALTTAASLVPPERKGRALAVLLSGTTVATVVGVPGGALLGASLGWRAAFWAVALLCLPATLGVLRGVPAGTTRGAPAAAGGAPGGAGAGVAATDIRSGGAAMDTGAGRADVRPALRDEFALLRSPRLLLVLLSGALVNAATFGAFTFLAPVVTGPAGLAEPWVPVVLVLFGAGSFAGVTLAGRFADAYPGRVLAFGGPPLLAGWCALALGAERPHVLPVLVLAQGTLSFALGATLIARALYAAEGAPTLAGAYATAALNVGATAGPLLAAATLGTPAGALGPFWSAAALVLLALPVALGAIRTTSV
ncbi:MULTISPECIES: MFS transporter [unclassified Streptomyces]|uniref:MFS transporter n=1 Tax=unclassified Streptomyces TaxID=2593676 RepID=UPI0016609B30|nr:MULTISPECIES: MFS transporter [unclassified Streptomyces]MBD0708239.1 chloramphenicol efflux pump [Streptomyces sp. CBMA291]MBD0717808.1 chloramphenicol efflux pump [Streptomyces sp. CBMA370]